MGICDRGHNWKCYAGGSGRYLHSCVDCGEVREQAWIVDSRGFTIGVEDMDDCRHVDLIVGTDYTLCTGCNQRVERMCEECGASVRPQWTSEDVMEMDMDMDIGNGYVLIDAEVGDCSEPRYHAAALVDVPEGYEIAGAIRLDAVNAVIDVVRS